MSAARAPKERRSKPRASRTTRASAKNIEIEHVRIEQLVVSQYNVRKRTNTDSPAFLEYVQDVKVRGLRQPLEVCPTDRLVKGLVEYEVFAGQRRYLAALAAGLRILPVIVRDEKDPAEAIRTSALENIHREDLSLLDLGDMVVLLMSLTNEAGAKRFPTQQDVAAFLTVSKGRVSAWLAATKLPESVKELAAKGELRAKATEAIAQAFDNPEDQEQAANVVAKAGLGSTEQARAVRELKKDKRLLSDEAAAKKVRERAREPKPRFSEADRKELIALCERTNQHEEIPALRRLDPAKHYAGFMRIHGRVHATAATTIQAHQAKASARPDAKRRMRELAAETSVASPGSPESLGMLAFEQDVANLVCVAKLRSRNLTPIEWEPSQALRKALLKELQHYLQSHAGQVDLANLPITSSQDDPADESHAGREGLATG